jgi:hypothetical protein
MTPSETVTTTIFDFFTDFLVERPSLDEIISFQLPDNVKQRALELLELNRSRKLSDDEQSEMDDLLLFDHIMTLLKAKARLKQAGKR